MKEILKKMAQAKQHVKNTKLKKEGKNTFSNYEYFTPAQIEKIVSDACQECGLLTAFSLKRNEIGETGFLTVYDLETGQSIIYEMATAIPEIKATNIAQQLGGCVTYTERYLKMSAFGIIDNSLDFDTTENAKKRLSDACEEMAKQDTKEKITAVWVKYKDLQRVKEFIEATKAAGAKLTQTPQ